MVLTVIGIIYYLPGVIFKLSITILPAPRNSNWFLNTGVAKGVPFDTPSTDLEGEHRGVTEMEGGLGPESSSAYQRSNKPPRC